MELGKSQILVLNKVRVLGAGPSQIYPYFGGVPMGNRHNCIELSWRKGDKYGQKQSLYANFNLFRRQQLHRLVLKIGHARINVASTGGSIVTRLKFKVILFNALRHATCAQLAPECKQ